MQVVANARISSTTEDIKIQFNSVLRRTSVFAAALDEFETNVDVQIGEGVIRQGNRMELGVVRLGNQTSELRFSARVIEQDISEPDWMV